MQEGYPERNNPIPMTIERKKVTYERYRYATSVILLVFLILTITGCTREQIVRELFLGGKEVLQMLGFFVLLLIVVGAWAHHKATGLIVTSIVVIGFLGYCHKSHRPYIEPPTSTPHAKLVFVVFTDSIDKNPYTVWVDDCDICVAEGTSIACHGQTRILYDKGEYTVRVTPGDHEIRVRYSASTGLSYSKTREDVRCRLNCETGEMVYLMLSDHDGNISVKQLNDLEHIIWTEYLKHSQAERLATPNLLEEIIRQEGRRYIERLVEDKFEEEGIPKDERIRLRPKLIENLQRELLGR